jgi:hypothetical protein
MGRPAYSARRHEALSIVRAADGGLEVGCGRIKIVRGEVSYFRHVVATLADALDLPGCAEALARGDGLGHTVAIMQPDVQTVPPNAWMIPNALRAAVTPGVGCGSMIVYDPDDWTREGDPCCPAPHEVLVSLLLQANACAAGSWTPPGGRETVAASPAEAVRLACRPTKAGEVLSFPCAIRNGRPDDIYVMESMAGVDLATRRACATKRTVVEIGQEDDASIGMFVPRMPVDRWLAAGVVPLARRVAAGGELELGLALPPPWVELTPWLPDRAAGQYQPVEIRKVHVAIAWWPCGLEGFTATEAPFAPDLYLVRSGRPAAVVSQSFPTKDLRFGRIANAGGWPASQLS